MLRWIVYICQPVTVEAHQVKEPLNLNNIYSIQWVNLKNVHQVSRPAVSEVYFLTQVADMNLSFNVIADSVYTSYWQTLFMNHAQQTTRLLILFGRTWVLSRTQKDILIMFFF